MPIKRLCWRHVPTGQSKIRSSYPTLNVLLMDVATRPYKMEEAQFHLPSTRLLMATGMLKNYNAVIAKLYLDILGLMTLLQP
jgi:hypothetical protein